MYHLILCLSFKCLHNLLLSVIDVKLNHLVIDIVINRHYILYTVDNGHYHDILLISQNLCSNHSLYSAYIWNYMRFNTDINIFLPFHGLQRNI